MGPYDPTKISLPERMETDRLIMLPYVVEDIDYHWECRSDEQLMAYFAKVEDDRAKLEAEFLEEFNKKVKYKFFYAVTLKDETGLSKNDNRTRTIATVLLRPYNKGEEMELGYIVSRRAWGKGIAPEASRALIKYGFGTMKLPHIMAMISPGNKNSERVIEKLGFKFSEVVTDDERSPELNKYILTRTDWASANLTGR